MSSASSLSYYGSSGINGIIDGGDGQRHLKCCEEMVLWSYQRPARKWPFVLLPVHLILANVRNFERISVFRLLTSG